MQTQPATAPKPVAPAAAAWSGASRVQAKKPASNKMAKNRKTRWKCFSDIETNYVCSMTNSTGGIKVFKDEGIRMGEMEQEE